MEEFKLSMLSLGIISITTNMLLLIVSFKVHNKTTDIQLIMMLALIDLITPGLSLILRLLSLKNEVRDVPLVCNIVGPINFVVLICSMTVVGLIALDRWSKVTTHIINWPPLIIISIIILSYFILIIFTSFHQKFILLDNQINCAPQINTSTLANLTVLMLGFILLLLVSIALLFYIKLMIFVINKHHQDQKNYNQQLIFNSDTQPLIYPVATRVTVTTIIYTIMVVPASILLILQGCQLLPQSIIINSLITSTLFGISLANPILILLTHTQIYRQLIHLF